LLTNFPYPQSSFEELRGVQWIIRVAFFHWADNLLSSSRILRLFASMLMAKWQDVEMLEEIRSSEVGADVPNSACVAPL
jgi:hypothetical protein